MVVDLGISRVVPRPPRGENEARVPRGQGLSLDAEAGVARPWSSPRLIDDPATTGAANFLSKGGIRAAMVPCPQAPFPGVRLELIGRLALFLNGHDGDQSLDQHIPAMAEDLNSQGPTTQSFSPGLASRSRVRA
jgi:hypothetical protein